MEVGIISKIVQQHIPCPDKNCGSSDAYCVYEDGHGYCYSCKKYYKNNKEFFLPDTTFTYEYLPWRGLSKETAKFYDIKTKIDGEGKPIEVGFKYPNGSYKIRSYDTKDFYTTGEISKGGLFGRDKFEAGSHKYVTITEGEIDAASIHQILRSPCVSVRSSTTAGRDCAADRSWLNSFERIYLAFDNDGPGRDAARDVARLFDYNKIYHVRFTRRKDANEYLVAGEGDELRNIWWNSKKYLPEQIDSDLQVFKEILDAPTPVGVPYPFKQLNDMLYGIRKGESVLFTAQEGVGKTEVMHAIEHHLLKETKDAVGAIFLEEPKRRHLQALAGLELQSPSTSQELLLQKVKYFLLWKGWSVQMIVFTSILILGAMIQTSFSTLFGFSSLPVLVALLFWTISLCVFQALVGKTSEEPSTTSPPDSK